MADGQTGNTLTMKSLIILMVFMIVVAGVSSYVFISVLVDGGDGGQADSEPAAQDTGLYFDMGSFTVNLSGSRGFQFIKADIQVQVTKANVIDELEIKNPQVRDIIITILRSKTIDDIEDPQAETIKNDIKNSLNQILTEGSVIGVYFTQLVVQ